MVEDVEVEGKPGELALVRSGRYRRVQIAIIRRHVLRVQCMCCSIATVVRTFQSLYEPQSLSLIRFHHHHQFIIILTTHVVASSTYLTNGPSALQTPPHLTSLPRGVLSMRQQGSAPSSEAHSTAPHSPRLKQPSSPQLIVKRGFLRGLCATPGIIVTDFQAKVCRRTLPVSDHSQAFRGLEGEVRCSRNSEKRQSSTTCLLYRGLRTIGGGSKLSFLATLRSHAILPHLRLILGSRSDSDVALLHRIYVASCGHNQDKVSLDRTHWYLLGFLRPDSVGGRSPCV
jgi:hypothetical protein